MFDDQDPGAAGAAACAAPPPRRSRQPGEITAAIQACLSRRPDGEATLGEIYVELDATFGETVARSSVRSALSFGLHDAWDRVGRGRYRLR